MERGAAFVRACLAELQRQLAILGQQQRGEEGGKEEEEGGVVINTAAIPISKQGKTNMLKVAIIE